MENTYLMQKKKKTLNNNISTKPGPVGIWSNPIFPPVYIISFHRQQSICRSSYQIRHHLPSQQWPSFLIFILMRVKNGVNTCPQFRSKVSFCSKILSSHDYFPSNGHFKQCFTQFLVLRMGSALTPALLSGAYSINIAAHSSFLLHRPPFATQLSLSSRTHLLRRSQDPERTLSKHQDRSKASSMASILDIPHVTNAPFPFCFTPFRSATYHFLASSSSFFLFLDS